MSSLWPWLAVAGAGALHGLNPATGWMFAAWRAQPLRTLAPIALGHAASVTLVAGTIALGLAMDRLTLQVLSGALALVVAVVHYLRRNCSAAPLRVPAGPIGLALWSFTMSTAHGTGMMLVPALTPLCIGNAPAREITASGSLSLALAAVGVHAVGMLAATGAIAFLIRRGFEAGTRLLPPVQRQLLTPNRPGALRPTSIILKFDSCAAEESDTHKDQKYQTDSE